MALLFLTHKRTITKQKNGVILRGIWLLATNNDYGLADLNVVELNNVPVAIRLQDGYLRLEVLL